ncbi:MAG: aldolase/citrate lyase family protein [Chloroflexota bacterium]|nr:aldolase/citrate lyase family protein [Chloroflexota bacterium]MDE2908488.1 aldolase/citrate lyase family protein [Chloroflexota bacterium]
MNPIELKAKWRRGEPSAGMWLSLTDITVADMIRDVGLDWVAIDTEHTAIDLQSLQNLLIALGDTPTIARVPGNDPVHIKRVLDMGADGVIVPHIYSAKDARLAVAACKYPPQGVRGTGPRRPSRYGLDEKGYLAAANDSTIVVIMIETVGVVEDFAAVLEVEGLDACMIGAVDLSASMGLLPAFDDPCVIAAIDQVAAKARAANMPLMSGRSPDADASSPFGWRNLLRQGLHVIPIASDQGLIMSGAREMLAVFRAHAANGAT